MNNNYKYEIIIYWSNEDETFIAEFLSYLAARLIYSTKPHAGSVPGYSTTDFPGRWLAAANRAKISKSYKSY